MKFFFLFIFFIVAFSLEINVNYSKNKNTAYEILTIENDIPFSCKKENKKVICIFDKEPSTPVFKTETIFFNVIPVFTNKHFQIEINVKENFILKSFEDSLYNNSIICKSYKKAKKWVIITSKKIPLINTKNSNGLNFYFKNSPKPYIGAIDENGNPININNQSKDVLKYFEIKKAYKKRRDVLADIDEFLKNYPDSIFSADVIYLKMKILDQENKTDEVIKLAKKWIKRYAFNESLPKVLLLIAKNYTKLGFMSDASYFYQRIITEYPNTKEAYLAMIYWGDQLYISGESKKALKLYKKALYSTKDINIASLAAMRLAQRYMDKGDIKTSFEYYKKVYQANKEFILKDKKKAYELAKTLSSHQLYSLAIQIGEDLLKKLKKLDDLYEPLMYHLSIWAYISENYKKASHWINRYLNKFPYGNYSDQLNSLRDKVLFEVNDKNTTKQLQRIDEIIAKYKGEDIAKKALVKKIKLLEKLKRYKDILKLENEIMKLDDKFLKNKKEYLKNIAKNYIVRLLKNKKCIKATQIIKKYRITLDKKYDVLIYNCALNARDFNLASIVCNKYLNSPNDKIFIKWMQRKIKALEGLEDYKNLIIAIDDLCRVKNKCFIYQLKKFFALWKLKRYKNALKTAKILEKKNDIKNADAFIKIVNYSLEHNDYLTAALYAKKIISLQERFKVYVYSPFVDFVYAKYTKNKKDAINVLKNLISRVKGEDKARAFYLLANLTGKKEYIDKCLNVKDSKLWKNLCKDAKTLF